MGQSGYSRAQVVTKANTAYANAEMALAEIRALREQAIKDRQTTESRLAATLKLARMEYNPAVRLAYANLWARLWWALTGKLPAVKS